MGLQGFTMALSSAQALPEAAAANSSSPPVKADVVSVEAADVETAKEKERMLENDALKISSSDVSEASTGSGRVSPNKSNNNNNKPSILRKNISRLRRRKRPTEAEAVATLQDEDTENRPTSAQSNEINILSEQQQQSSREQPQEDVEEAKLESTLSNDEEDSNQNNSSSPKISIVLAHDNEVVVEQLLPYAAAAATTKTPKSEAKTPEQADLFYSPLKLLSPPQTRTSTASATAQQPKGIIKRHSSINRLSSSSLGSLGAPTGPSRRVSFDETTIVKQERRRKSTFEGLRMAMPIILPYLIAVLILILSSLVPPATPPTPEPKVNDKGFMSKFVTVSVRSSEKTASEASIKQHHYASRSFSSSSPFVGGNNVTETRSRSSIIRQNLSEALWTPHSVYDRVVGKSNDTRSQ